MSERTEERLRAALHAEADGVRIDPDAWSAVQRRARRWRGPKIAGIALAAAAVVTAVVGIGLDAARDERTTVDVVPAATTTTVPAPEVPAFDSIWPFTNQDQLDAYLAEPGIGMFFDPEATALEFAREYLGMTDPTSVHGFVPAEGFSGSVEVQPKPGAGPITRIWVHRYGGDEGAYAAYFAETDNIRPDRGAIESEPLGAHIELTGTSTAFEATVNVEVRDLDGTVLGRTFVMGGANGEFAPFSGSLTIEKPTPSEGVLIFTTESAEDGSVLEATVVRVRFWPDADEDENEYSVFFHRGEELVEVRRSGPATSGVLRQALEALFDGPRPEDGEGLGSLFSEDTAGLLGSVSVVDGTAIVDLGGTVNNASTSAGSVVFLAELDATVFQFPTVERIEYRLEGSCEAFWSWLQYGDGCPIIERD